MSQTAPAALRAASKMGLLKPSRGFSLIEMIVAVILVGILYIIAIDKLVEMRADAERVAMENVVGALKSALSIEVAAHIVRDDIKGLYTLEGTNPMRRLSEKPKSYLGEFAGPDPASVEGGNWYFDTRAAALIYRVQYGDFFKTPLPGSPRARFAVRLDYDDLNGNRIFDQSAEEVHGLRLEALESYAWSVS